VDVIERITRRERAAWDVLTSAEARATAARNLWAELHGILAELAIAAAEQAEPLSHLAGEEVTRDAA